MSAINQALSKLANKDSEAAASIEKAQVANIKQRSVLPWIVVGFALSLAMGGWAVSQQAEQVVVTSVDLASSQVVTPNEVTTQVTLTDSPTSKMITEPSATIFTPEVVKPVKQAPTKTDIVVQPKSIAVKSNELPKAEPQKSILVAKVSSQQPSSNMIVEQVELTPKQLAAKALERAKKAVDSNNIDEALRNYTEALRYTPYDENARQRLAALYYGKGNARKAFDILQTGIKLNEDGETLRIALSKMLVKESQQEAALTPLVHLPDHPSLEYLSLRAALAQRAKQDAIALETYQQLVLIQEDNARWWLGLAIQQERNLEMSQAKTSYQQALSNVGLSRQSQTFAQDRLKLLQSLEDTSSAN
ncbi:hypothetical protein J4N42_01840 [Vibrio sp. SCSIO 43135]|uniref:tetratricopeptide repeat protein n=1 Tax=Vibrio sp. SCSIO 43135 TaxID=2819096 RepID=UPI002075219D|nr:tetratricopeptide repeat protein [Vibrio sp. SCSIO 43135]USD41495.1 hypothetical protein J4N42_01840 [Vibrio sp. SCSIO 43135]